MTNSPAHSLYPGINAHVNSYLQNEPGGWRGFHGQYLNVLLIMLDPLLPEGYYATSEPGLQVDVINEDFHIEYRSQSVPDIGLYRTPDSPIGTSNAVMEASFPIALLRLIDMLTIDEQEMLSLGVYQSSDDGSDPLVTRLELLSPANKPGGLHHEQYKRKRWETLQAGINLIEIDYLHQTPPVLRQLPRYPRDRDAYPYYVLVSDPHPVIEQGTTQIFGSGVLDPLPRVKLPLLTTQTVILDLQAAYTQAIHALRFYQRITRRTPLPVHFDRYREDDQMRLREHLARMATPSDATTEDL